MYNIACQVILFNFSFLMINESIKNSRYFENLKSWTFCWKADRCSCGRVTVLYYLDCTGTFSDSETDTPHLLPFLFFIFFCYYPAMDSNIWMLELNAFMPWLPLPHVHLIHDSQIWPQNRAISEPFKTLRNTSLPEHINQPHLRWKILVMSTKKY